jgi:polyprenyldihydroxybenzoate methyltransferase/3-demethylubiquinol 3-O-methyltransferase
MELLVKKLPNHLRPVAKLLFTANRNQSTRILSVNANSKTTAKIFATSRLDNRLTVKQLSTSASLASPDTFETFQSTANEKEINRFKVHANSWWIEGGEYDALHRMNQLRVPMIRDALANYLTTMPKSERDKIVQTAAEHEQNVTDSGSSSEPLAGFNILDVGCGGGILSEPLARLGAVVTGVDACKENIISAQMRAQTEFARSGEQARFYKRLRYLHCTVEELAAVEENFGYFDAVVFSEVIEHVDNLSGFVDQAGRLLKNHGYMFATTINKTPQSYALAIVAAEYLLNIVAKGTHDWNKFVAPEDLKQLFRQNEVSTQFEMGMCYNPVTKNWSWSQDKSVNYALYGQKMKTSL